ncbi:MAG TPA: IS21 family transposase, partial [Bdellovibrionales bacterium]|nr:IS21 family transposase [Bdellovibrionales bacterium]
MTMMIPAEVQAEILALHFGSKKGTRAIAKQLGISRNAVRRVVEHRKVSLRPEPSGPRKSILDPFKPKVEEMLQRDPSITAARVLQQIRREGFLGGRCAVQYYVRQLRAVSQRPREAFLRLDFPAGETAQVDWGEFGTPFGDGVKIHCFLMVLCHSRLLYIEFTRSEKFEEFIRCHENAFRFFGSRVPLEIWYDNLRSAVTERMGGVIRFNSRFLAYLGHHGIRPHACNPARGNEKGRVEDSVKFVRSSFWAGRSFKNFEDLCTQSAHWRDEFANRREHRSTRKISVLYFESAEKPLLRPMNPHPYDTSEVLSRVVPPNFLITFETNRYSVPWTLVGLTLTIKANDQCIDFYYQERRVALHIRSYDKYQVFENREHFKELLERKPGVTKESWQIQAVKNIGPAMSKYLELIRAGHRSMRKEVSKILALATIYGESAVNSACQALLAAGIIGAENLELSLKSSHHPSEHEL